MHKTSSKRSKTQRPLVWVMAVAGTLLGAHSAAADFEATPSPTSVVEASPTVEYSTPIPEASPTAAYPTPTAYPTVEASPTADNAPEPLTCEDGFVATSGNCVSPNIL